MKITAGTNISFNMNNPDTASFHYYPPGENASHYNVPFFTATNLDPSIERTVSFIGQAGVPGAGPMLFDYAVITVDQDSESATTSASPSSSAQPSCVSTYIAHQISDPRAELPGTIVLIVSIQRSSFILGDSTVPPSPLPSHESKTGAIVGAVVALVGGLVLIGGIIMFLRRRSRRRASSTGTNTGMDPQNHAAGAARMTATNLMAQPSGYQPPFATSSHDAMSSSGGSMVVSPLSTTVPSPTSRSEKRGSL
jgi:hypothetical protein